jgi:N-acetylglucosaminyl-diphospho-decaprenol L-rhamnosyltransferase
MSAILHIAIVSHGHESLLIASRMGGLLTPEFQQHPNIKIWVKDNLPCAALRDFCQTHQINYTAEQAGKGFGHNNNILFRQIEQQAGFAEDDLFVIMNPDLTTDPSTLFALAQQMQQEHVQLATLNLYRDAALTQVDTNIRHFPNWLSFLLMPIHKTSTHPYDKAALQNPSWVEWASGAFLMCTPSHYRQLGGFDEAYFMYFEDVDFCYRSYLKLGKTVRYYPQLKAVHSAAHKNRDLFSPHSRWFFTSFMRFLKQRHFVLGDVQNKQNMMTTRGQ